MANSTHNDPTVIQAGTVFINGTQQNSPVNLEGGTLGGICDQPMGMFMKTLRMAVSVFALILASAVPGSAQATVFVTGNTTFTVTWEGVKHRPLC